MKTILRSSFACAALAAAPLSAQNPPQELLAGLRVPIQAQTDPAGHGRGLWTAGRDWRASLHDGVCFEAPQPAAVGALPWRWRTTAVLVGGEPRPLAAAAQPRLCGGFRCEYALGPATEAYDVHAAGLEQTFVLHEATDRDVVLRGAVQSALVAAPRGYAHGPIDFVPAAGGNGVRYGAAFAVDARGERLPLATAWTGESLQIHVPGSWLAQAAWPVVVDPLLTTVLLDSSTTLPVTHMVVERDERNANKELGIAFTRAWNGSGHDLFFVLVDDNLQSPTVVFSRIGATIDPDPSLAFVTGPNKWVLAYTAWDYAISGERGILHRHDGGDATVSNTTEWAPNPAGRRQRALRVGGNRSAGPSAATLLVFESESTTTTGNTSTTRVYSCLYDAATSAAGTPLHLAGGTVNFPGDSEAPSVSRDRGLGSWIVAWQHLHGLPFHWDVAAQRIAGNGVAAAGTLVTDRTGLEHLLGPVVDGQHGSYLLTFQTVPLGPLTGPQQAGHSLRAMTFTWGDAAIAPTAVGASQPVLGPANYAAYRALAVAFDKVTGAHWGVSTSQVLFTTPRTQLLVLGHDARPRDLPYLANTDSVATGIAFDADAHQFAVGFGDTQNGFHRANAVRFAYPAQQPPTSYGSGCGGAQNQAIGSFLAGDDACALRLLAATANAPAVLAVGLGATNVPLPAPFLPGCSLLVDLGPGSEIATLAMSTNALGRADVPLPLPSSLPDLDLHVQWIYWNALGTGFLATSGLRAQIR